MELDPTAACSILGISRSCTELDIKRAYRRLSLLYHPDKRRNGDFDATKFNELKKAYNYLIQIKEIERSRGLIRETNLSQPLQQLSPNEYDLSLTLEEIYRGATQTRPITRTIIDEHGLEVREEVQLSVTVDRGSIEGTRILLSREGNREAGKIPANVVFIVRELSHKIFTRVRWDLEYMESISVEDACSGEVILKCLGENETNFKHPVSEVITKSTIIRVPNRGMPVLKGNGKFGDLVVRFKLLPALKQDPPIFKDVVLTFDQMRLGYLKKLKIIRVIVDEDGDEREESKILTIDIEPGKPNKRYVFPKEGDQRPGRIPADIICVVRNENFGKNKRNRGKKTPDKLKQNQLNNLTPSSIAGSMQNLSLNTPPSTSANTNFNQRTKQNWRTSNPSPRQTASNNNNNRNSKAPNSNFRLRTIDTFKKDNPDFKLEDLPKTESPISNLMVNKRTFNTNRNPNFSNLPSENGQNRNTGNRNFNQNAKQPNVPGQGANRLRTSSQNSNSSEPHPRRNPNLIPRMPSNQNIPTDLPAPITHEETIKIENFLDHLNGTESSNFSYPIRIEVAPYTFLVEVFGNEDNPEHVSIVVRNISLLTDQLQVSIELAIAKRSGTKWCQRSFNGTFNSTRSSTGAYRKFIQYINRNFLRDSAHSFLVNGALHLSVAMSVTHIPRNSKPSVPFKQPAKPKADSSSIGGASFSNNSNPIASTTPKQAATKLPSREATNNFAFGNFSQPKPTNRSVDNPFDDNYRSPYSYLNDNSKSFPKSTVEPEKSANTNPFVSAQPSTASSRAFSTFSQNTKSEPKSEVPKTNTNPFVSAQTSTASSRASSTFSHNTKSEPKSEVPKTNAYPNYIHQDNFSRQPASTERRAYTSSNSFKVNSSASEQKSKEEKCIIS